MLITAALLLIIALQFNILAQFERPHARWVFVGVHLVLLAVLFFSQGILADKEALKYVGCAEDVVHGDLKDLFGNYLKYASYILFLVPFVAIGLPKLAVLAQVILGIAAAFALGRLVVRLTGSTSFGNIAVLILLICVPVQTWTLALYTESFFTSITVLFIERISRNERADLWSYLVGAVSVFARPVGMLFVGPALVWKWTRDLSRAFRNTSRVAGCVGVLLVAMLLPGIERAQLEPIVEAQVIAGVPGTTGAMAEFSGSSIADAQLFLMDRLPMGEWACLAGQRMRSLFMLHRPWYTTYHNVSVSLFYLLYPLAIWGIWAYRKSSVVRLFCAMLLLQTLLVGFTHDEWSGRFLVPLLPWIILLGTLGIAGFSRRSDTIGSGSS